MKIEVSVFVFTNTFQVSRIQEMAHDSSAKKFLRCTHSTPHRLAQGLDATNPVTTKILRLHLTQKLSNYRGSDVRGDRQFELSSQND